MSWGVEFKQALHQPKSVEFESMLSLFSNIFICRDDDHSRIWMPNPSGKFSSKSFYKTLELRLGNSHLCTHLVRV